ncbi:MAG: hypothetical protein ACJATN_002924, partial [Neolewinella sp.]
MKASPSVFIDHLHQVRPSATILVRAGIGALLVVAFGQVIALIVRTIKCFEPGFSLPRILPDPKQGSLRSPPVPLLVEQLATVDCHASVAFSKANYPPGKFFGVFASAFFYQLFKDGEHVGFYGLKARANENPLLIIIDFVRDLQLHS